MILMLAIGYTLYNFKHVRNSEDGLTLNWIALALIALDVIAMVVLSQSNGTVNSFIAIVLGFIVPIISLVLTVIAVYVAKPDDKDSGQGPR
jgi:uncharacterized Tic20 family protein